MDAVALYAGRVILESAEHGLEGHEMALIAKSACVQ